MAENPTNRRAVKFWTSDFGTAVTTADGWLSMLARLAAAAERVLSLVWPAGPGASDWPSLPPCLLSSLLACLAWQTASLDPSNHLINSPPVAHDDDDDGDEGGREGGRKNVDVHIRGVMDHLPCSFPKRHATPRPPARPPVGRWLPQSVARFSLTHSVTPTEHSLTLDS